MNREAKTEIEKVKADAIKAKIEKEYREHNQKVLNAKSLDTLPAFDRDLNDPNEQKWVVKIPISEKIHGFVNCVVFENRVINRRYERVGYSLPVPVLKGWRVGKSSGQLITERGYEQTTYGSLRLTDKRLVLNPVGSGLKPIQIPYKKIEGYTVGDDFIEVWTGKEYPTMFKLIEKFGEESDVCAKILGLYTNSTSQT